MNNRELMLNRLRQDLIGPRGGDEELVDERPSERYVSGMLFPKKTRVKDDENDEINVINMKDSDSELDTGVATFRNFKPATAGISFAAKPGSDTVSELNIVIRCGLYRKQPAGRDNKLEGTDETPNLDVEQSAGEGFNNFWKRFPVECDLNLSISNDFEKVALDELGLPSAFLYVKRTRISGVDTITVQLVNDFEPSTGDGYDVIEENTLFQVELEISCLDKTEFHPRFLGNAGNDEDAKASQLLFRKINEFATGHNCSASWDVDKAIPDTVRLEWIPEVETKAVSPLGDEAIIARIAETSLGILSANAIYSGTDEQIFELMDALSDGYGKWINRTYKQASTELKEPYLEQADKNLTYCKTAKDRIEEGIQYLKDNKDALKAFRLANLVMRIQRSWSEGATDWEDRKGTDLIWYPFQLAFALMCMASVSERSHPDRDIFDLIWFPTGGGKTEAYLLVSAYTMIRRRLINDDAVSSGVSVMMRYTLRTLTVQQFQRATAVITACEVIRRERYKELGDEPFTIGLWVGDDTSPNRITTAIERLEDSYSTSGPDLLEYCPSCIKHKVLLKWEPDESRQRIRCFCPPDECKAENSLGEIPVLTVDDLIYQNPPSLLIATVDKFAQIVRNPNTRSLFGRDRGTLPPDLIIQDELHLISGPLGSMTGLYEIAIDELCRHESYPVKIIGSTATIRNASEQVRALYDRSSFQFPPPGIDDGDSGFAKKSLYENGRLYVGLTSAGRSPKYVLQAIAASLLQSAGSDELDDSNRQFYSTLVSYYNSIKELGGALVAMQDDVPKTISGIAKQREEAPRAIEIPEELTSRIASSEIPKILRRLDLADIKSSEFVHILLASNMLSVGVDIPRLGLMLVNGQPKSIAEYIQATSRVGRSQDGPGLVVTLFNHNKIRDRAHFETFTTWHSSLYRSVEPSSVTPFSPRARDKALHAPLIALCRLLLGMGDPPRLTENYKTRIINELLPIFEKRVMAVDEREVKDTVQELSQFLEYWDDRGDVKYYWDGYKFKESLLISAEDAATKAALGWKPSYARSTPNNLRNVEASALFKLQRRFKAAEKGKTNAE